MVDAVDLEAAKQRLMTKIKIDESTGCWEWTGCKIRGGYGLAWDGKKMKVAHRLSYEIHRGPIKNGMIACHVCDNPACINPDHLFLGSQAENIADMITKGRLVSGSDRYNSKLTEADVRAILGAKGITQQRLADQYGVNRSLISNIRCGRAWKQLAR
jgi:hypothetical protein